MGWRRVAPTVCGSLLPRPWFRRLILRASDCTRPGCNNEAVARWVFDLATKRSDAEFELVDIADYNLPLLDEPAPPCLGQYSHAHTKRWAAKIVSFDAFVFVTPEYNHGIPGALKNAIDYLFREWNNKAAAFVSYGGIGGARAAEQLRLVMGELMVADVRQQVMLSMFTDFENFSAFKPAAVHSRELNALLDQVIAWGTALRSLRSRARNTDIATEEVYK
jgi:NAD(P)H-dependent FMN reductase